MNKIKYSSDGFQYIMVVPPHGGEVPVSNLIGYRFWSKPELLNPKRAEREYVHEFKVLHPHRTHSSYPSY